MNFLRLASHDLIALSKAVGGSRVCAEIATDLMSIEMAQIMNPKFKSEKDDSEEGDEVL